MTSITETENGNVVRQTVDTTQQSSIKISCNAKGDYAWEIKVYADVPDEMKEKLGKYKLIAIEMAV